jgi:hypothetical protein
MRALYRARAVAARIGRVRIRADVATRMLCVKEPIIEQISKAHRQLRT